jgi:predicted HD phosphohydrolase
VKPTFGEPVSQLEPALQAAWFATQAKSAPTLVAAALLHDIGHLLHDLGENAADEGVDTRHEDAGYGWLLARFGPAVTEPVRLHVAANQAYLSQLTALLATWQVVAAEPSTARSTIVQPGLVPGPVKDTVEKP